MATDCTPTPPTPEDVLVTVDHMVGQLATLRARLTAYAADPDETGLIHEANRLARILEGTTGQAKKKIHALVEFDTLVDQLVDDVTDHLQHQAPTA